MRNVRTNPLFNVLLVSLTEDSDMLKAPTHHGRHPPITASVADAASEACGIGFAAGKAEGADEARGAVTLPSPEAGRALYQDMREILSGMEEALRQSSSIQQQRRRVNPPHMERGIFPLQHEAEEMEEVEPSSSKFPGFLAPPSRVTTTIEADAMAMSSSSGGQHRTEPPCAAEEAEQDKASFLQQRRSTSGGSSAAASTLLLRVGADNVALPQSRSSGGGATLVAAASLWDLGAQEVSEEKDGPTSSTRGEGQTLAALSAKVAALERQLLSAAPTEGRRAATSSTSKGLSSGASAKGKRPPLSSSAAVSKRNPMRPLKPKRLGAGNPMMSELDDDGDERRLREELQELEAALNRRRQAQK